MQTHKAVDLTTEFLEGLKRPLIAKTIVHPSRVYYEAFTVKIISILRDNVSVWKHTISIDFTGSEIIMKPKVYMVLQYTQ